MEETIADAIVRVTRSHPSAREKWLVAEEPVFVAVGTLEVE
jgi:hypothetical protein